MRRLDQNQKSVEGEEVLKLLSNKQLEFLREIYEQGGQDLIEIFDLLAMRAKEMVYVYSKPGKSVDELIEVNGKQNLQSGRVSMLLLLDYLISHAGNSLEKNMEGREK
jgi:hypothetical protein